MAYQPTMYSQAQVTNQNTVSNIETQKKIKQNTIAHIETPNLTET